MMIVSDGAKCKPWLVCVTLVFLIMLIFSITLLVVGSRLRGELNQTVHIGGFSHTTCTLEAVTVTETTTTTWIAVWKRAENEQSIVENPFAARSTEALALADTNNYPLAATNGTTPTHIACMCERSSHAPPPPLNSYPIVNGQFPVDGICMLNVDMIEYMQLTGFVYGYAGATLIAIGSLTLVFTLFGAALVCIGKGWCYCCTKSGREMRDYYSQNTE